MTAVQQTPVAGARFKRSDLNTVRFPGKPPMGTVDVVFGRVLAVHIDDEFITPDGLVDVLKIKPLARMAACRCEKPTQYTSGFSLSSIMCSHGMPVRVIN